jgi:hypothetical protein
MKIDKNKIIKFVKVIINSFFLEKKMNKFNKVKIIFVGNGK